ncbi:MAG TPA: hypothetical protein VK209_07775, partial [Candidatus Sulfotelmatobacter sp.]|nr:hypothetical protein [Candidatus Sulfotelmatobacter sp.]
IFYLTGLFAILSPLFPFWVTRFVARGKEGAIKTGVSANFIVALIATVTYILIIPLILDIFNVTSIALLIFLIAAVQIVNLYLNAIFEACLRVVKPQATGYGLLIEEVVKVGLAFSIFFGLHQLFLGAIIGIIVGALTQAIFYLWLLRNYLHQAIHWGYLREWLKGSTALVYNIIGGQLVGFILYLLVYFGGESALGYYSAAITFSTIIGYAFSLTFALYPKMLAEECPEDIIISFKNMLMFALPMATITLTMSTSLLTILNVSYNVASPVLILLAVDALIVLVLQFYTQCLTGVETLDVEGRISIRELMRSKIFKVFTLQYVQAAIALPAVYFVLTKAALSGPVQAAMSVVIINIFAHVVTFAAIYLLMHHEFRLIVPWLSVIKYVLAAIVLGLVLLFSPQTTTLTATFVKVLLGAALYAMLLFAIDADSRKLAKRIIEEIGVMFH